MSSYSITRVVNFGRCLCPNPGHYCTLFYTYTVCLSNVRSTKIVRSREGETYEEVFPDFEAPSVASTFNADQLKEALLAIQQKEIEYPEFLRRIMIAGISRYEVYINEFKTIYFGQQEESYIENFPPSFLKK